MSEMRRDPVIGRWVIITNEEIELVKSALFAKGLKECPFCPGNEAGTPHELLAYSDIVGRAPDTPGWKVRVIPNKFPVLSVEGTILREGRGMFDVMNGVGANEIIIETPDHFKDISELPLNHIALIFSAYKARMLDLKQDRRLKYTLVYRNWGEDAGAHIDHAHSALVSTTIIPQNIKDEFKGARKYFEYKERCVYCDIIRQEQHDRERVIAENDDFIVIAPFASHFPYMMWLLPKEHNEDFMRISDEKIMTLADILKNVLGKMNVLLNYPAYNYIIHTASNGGGKNPSEYHWHLVIIPKLKQLSGIELGGGYFINPVSPEKAASDLKGADYGER